MVARNFFKSVAGYYSRPVVKYHFRIVRNVFSPNRLQANRLFSAAGKFPKPLVTLHHCWLWDWASAGELLLTCWTSGEGGGNYIQETFIMFFCPCNAEYCVFTARPWCCHFCFHVRSMKSLSTPHQGQIYFTKADPHLSSDVEESPVLCQNHVAWE